MQSEAPADPIYFSRYDISYVYLKSVTIYLPRDAFYPVSILDILCYHIIIHIQILPGCKRRLADLTD